MIEERGYDHNLFEIIHINYEKISYCSSNMDVMWLGGGQWFCENVAKVSKVIIACKRVKVGWEYFKICYVIYGGPFYRNLNLL